MTTLLVGATAASAVALVLVGDRPARRWIKPLSSLGFSTVGLSVGALDSSYGRWIMVGLVLGAIGDVALLGDSSRPFLAGLTAFLLGHLAYGVAFAGEPHRSTGVALVVAAATGAGAWMWLRGHVGGPMRTPVAAYVVVIASMLWVAVMSWDPRPLGAVGATLFVVSDLAVARQRFVTPSRWNPRVGLPLYYAGQLLLALSTGVPSPRY